VKENDSKRYGDKEHNTNCKHLPQTHGPQLTKEWNSGERETVCVRSGLGVVT